MAEADRRVARFVSRRHGVTAAAELRTMGLDKSAIARRVSDGRLTPLYRGVYLVGPGKPSRHGRWMAAVLAAGEAGYLSHQSAAALWEIRTTSSDLIHITVLGRSRRRRRGNLRLHTARHLAPSDRTVVAGIPVTGVPRTLLDLSTVLAPEQLRRAYERAERLRILDHAALRDLAGRSNGHRGIARLRALLPHDPTPATETWSELERLFAELMRGSGLPPYQRNVVVAGHVVDAYWPHAKLVVALQSYEFHSDREAFERDHAKFAHLRRAGHDVLPVTHRQVTTAPETVVATIAALLG